MQRAPQSVHYDTTAFSAIKSRPLPTIEVLFCTIDGRIEGIARHMPPRESGVRYLVSWQQSADFLKANETPAPPAEITARDDFSVTALHGTGLSANRNHAVSCATGDLLLLSDDDCRYRAEHFAAIRHAFAALPHADILVLRAEETDGELLPKPYPAAPVPYTKRPKGFYASSVEIALRRAALPLPAFDTRFGLGAPFLGCCEEELFLHEAQRAGKSVWLYPATVVSTPAATTGTRFRTDTAAQRAVGALHAVIHGRAGALLRAVKYAALLRAPLTDKAALFTHMAEGISYISRTPRP